MSKAKAPRVFVPLTKVDEEQRLVYGRITQEILDKSGEVMDYESSKPFFEKWSNDINEASGGLSKGNVRVMHGLSVAGKLTDLSFDDAELAIDVCAKIVDDAEWTKVVEGCYTGFSVGGKYEKRWTETANDNTKIKKFTAGPNEVSLVDNPCVPSATFAMVKADGAEEQIAFKVQNDDEEWPSFSKADADAQQAQEVPAVEQPKTAIEKAIASVAEAPTNDAVVSRAEELAKAANDGTTWMTHVEAARDQLVKEAKGGSDESDEGDSAKEKKGKDKSGDDDETTDDNASTVEKTTPPGVKQVWTASDGQVFDKKADAEEHEATLAKNAQPETEADKLRKRLEAATTPAEPVVVIGLFEDYDRLGKVFNALSTPWDPEASAPKLEKGMYSINRFSNVLSDMASLSRCIKAEAAREGGDEEDKAVSDALIACVKSLGTSFLDYAKNQIEELLAGQDDEVLVSTYDYYYAAAQENGEDQLAKDVCSVIDEGRESSRERREELSKSFGYVEATLESTDELSPPMQKRFDELTASNESLKKVAEDAVSAVETLTKRVKEIEDTPLPRAPNPANIAFRGGDGNFFGKAANTQEEKMEVLQDMLKTYGPDGLALELIKVAQQNPQQIMTRG